MVACFICDAKLFGERMRVCSSITPHSNVPFPEKIAELLGEDFVIIVTPADHMCKKCTTLFTNMDKWEYNLKIVKNSITTSIQKKYGILPSDHTVQNVVIINGNIQVEEPLEQGQREVSSGLTLGVPPTVTPTVTPTAAIVAPVQSSLKLLKTQPFQPQQQQLQQKQLQKQQPQQQHSQQQHPQQQHPQQQHPHQQPLPTLLKCNNKTKIYKCGFCSFQSKDLGHVRFHMRSIHSIRKETENPILEQAPAIALTPIPQPKKRLYRCQVCSKSFDIRTSCLNHIQKDHNKMTVSTSNEVKKTDGPRQAKLIKLDPSKTQENNHQADVPMDVDENQQDNKGTIDTDIMLNDNVPTEGSADAEQGETKNSNEEEVPENSQEDKTVKVFNSIKKTEPAEEDAAEEEENKEDTVKENKEVAAEEDKNDAAEEEDKEEAAEEENKEDATEEEEAENTAVPEQEEADQDSVEKESEKDSANVENKPEDLDIESMLAAIHSDNPSTNDDVDTQNKA